LPKAAAIKVGVFCLVAALVSMTIFNTLAGSSGSGAEHYDAVFTDASGVRAGDDVRVAGVKVGRVDSTELRGDGLADVSFSLQRGVPITDSTFVHIRFANLIGQRYLALVPGESAGTALDQEATIPASRTQPAVDLTLLFNNLQPVLTSLEPGQMNVFFNDLIHVLQGEGGTVVSLLRNAATLAKQFNESDAVFGQVVENMSLLLESTTSHRAEIHQLIDGLTALVSGVADQRDEIFNSVDAIASLMRVTSSIVERSAPYVTTMVRSLQKLANEMNRNAVPFLESLKASKKVMWLTSHIMGYGEWWNLYACNVRYHGLINENYGGSPHSSRCR
jgi:phospholipid/cholesterol/gamma-HCH transport system substrate-binding protein